MELGSGVGLLGIHLLKTCPSIQEYTFTDTNNSVLNFLNFNITLNLSQESSADAAASYKQAMKLGPPSVITSSNADSVIAYYKRPSDKEKQQASVSLRKLDWNHGLPPKWNLRDFDLILGSDIVYERSLIPPLVDVLKSSMELDPRRRAYIACTEKLYDP
ncbi:Uncharacterized protein FKW44_001158 [Caligus rogercresseyi]|uniref:Uncharacterized protein n=1 Tax=Caligus rogercresseyi TaxID=217165 RepID=A0A7T8QVC8_CALRO|nr:Uncharacterized protein FKW44_001158 [Caligus rogercresseyi]